MWQNRLLKRIEILVNVKNAAVNHLDIVEASGSAREKFPIVLPWVPGHEFSGVIEEVGKDVTLLKQVTLFSETANLVLCSGHAVKPGTVVKKPANLSFAEAASVPVAAQTAWQGIFTHGQLAKGQTILIHGGAGGVGAGSGFICEPVKRAA